MPADLAEDCSGTDDAASERSGAEGRANGAGGSFNAAVWSPGEQQYGIVGLLICRGAVAEAGENGDKPSEIATLKVVDTRACSFPAAPPGRRRGSGGGPATHSDDEGYVSEGEHGEQTGPATWSGRPGSWWRVHNLLGEDLIVRDGVSLRSAQLRRVPPGELVQQAGNARCLLSGPAKGCIRLPVRPAGWVTADAVKAGGPKYLVRASVPRWRVVYAPDNGKGGGGVIVREGEDLASEEVMVLHRGDVVEQAGPAAIRRHDGIVRMPVTATVIRRIDVENGEAEANGHAPRSSVSGKTLGWVTADASAAGGPVFFKPLAEADRGDKQQQRRRRPKAAA